MKRNSGWFVPVAVLITCIPCLLVPVAAALIASGALGGVLSLLGVPWLLALLSAVAAGAALFVIRLRRRRSATCALPRETSDPA